MKVVLKLALAFYNRIQGQRGKGGMKIKAFLSFFVFTYLLISLPAIFGIGYVIDWVPEATLLQKFNGYIFHGLLNNFILKTIIASIAGIAGNMVISKRRRTE